MNSKKFINDVSNCVDDSIKGFVSVFPGLYFHEKYRFVTKSQIEVAPKVAVISGGGSGHEPFCTGYVGNGMLSAAVAGNVFASPPKNHILQAIMLLSQYYQGGILVIIPNYTGDCLNFGMAIEDARNNGINVESIIVGDDCASGHNSVAGRRGMCGLLFAFKIAGALAEQGENINTIIIYLNQVLTNISTLGISSKPCSLPGQGPLFIISEDEMELGTGVHGEAGIMKMNFSKADDAVETVLNKLLGSFDSDNFSAIVLVNNLGSTTELEQNIICSEVFKQLTFRGIRVERIFSGMLMTSLDMSGFQISILKLPETQREYWIKLLDFETNAPRWVGSLMSISNQAPSKFKYVDKQIQIQEQINKFQLTVEQKKIFQTCLIAVSKALTENEIKLNDLDSGCGDGDCGTTLKGLAVGINKQLLDSDFQSPAVVLKMLSDIAENKMGGTSGALFSLCFSSMRNHFINSNLHILPVIWGMAWITGMKTIKKYGHAKIGDRTIIDAMEPAAIKFNELISNNSEDIKTALSAALISAKNGCAKTKNMAARAGRASYVNKKHITDVDAGAHGFVVCLEAIEKCF